MKKNIGNLVQRSGQFSIYPLVHPSSCGGSNIVLPGPVAQPCKYMTLHGAHQGSISLLVAPTTVRAFSQLQTVRFLSTLFFFS